MRQAANWPQGAPAGLEPGPQPDSDRPWPRDDRIDFRPERGDAVGIATSRLVALDEAAERTIFVEQVAREQFERPAIVADSGADVDGRERIEIAINIPFDETNVAPTPSLISGGELHM